MSEASSELAFSQDSAAIATDPNTETKLTPFRILSGVIIRPRATFERLREAKRAHWWLVFILTMVSAILLAAATSAAQASMMQGFTPPEGMEGVEMPAAAVQSSPILTIAGTALGSIVSTLAGYLLIVLVVFAFGLVLGGKATFKQVVNVSIWTTLPYAVRGLVQAIASFVTGNVAVSGLSGVLTTMESASLPLLATVLGKIDVYTIWSLVLLTIGVSVLYKLSKGKTLIIVISYVVIALGLTLALNAAISAISSLFGGGNGGNGGPGGPGLGFRF
jgi:hypothetical protein